MIDSSVRDTYGKSVFLAIVGAELNDFLALREHPNPLDDRSLKSVRIDDHGVWVHPSFDELTWTYLCESDDPKVDPMSQPALPFDFTAAQLAAFLLDGIGWFIRQRYGRWFAGPDPLALEGVGGTQGTRARHALQMAYQSYRDAVYQVGALDERYLDGDELADLHDIARRKEESPKRYEKRTARLYQAITAANARTSAAKDEARAEKAKWRKNMVRALLKFDPVGITQPPNRRAVKQKGELLNERAETIREWLHANGHDPMKPPQANGQIGLKREVRDALVNRGELGFRGTVANFDKAWNAYLAWVKKQRKDTQST